jgi:hypothetical protein
MHSTLNTFSLFRILTFWYGSGSSDPYLCCAFFEETKVPSTHADHVLQHRWVSLNYYRKIKKSLKFFLLSVILFRPVYIFINKHILYKVTLHILTNAVNVSQFTV